SIKKTGTLESGNWERHRRPSIERPPIGTRIECSVRVSGAVVERPQWYNGRMTAQSQPRRLKARGRDPATSARPPVLANGTTSEAASKTRGFPLESRCCDMALIERSRAGLGRLGSGKFRPSAHRRERLTVGTSRWFGKKSFASQGQANLK